MIMVLVFQRWVICAYNQVHRGCILRAYADIPNNYLSSNAGLFAQVHRHIDVFLIIILIAQRWIICAHELIPQRDKSVFYVRTQVFLIMVLVFQCWVICAYNQVYRHT